MWCTSNTAWTNGTLGLRWLTDVFEPSTSTLNGERRILIVDGHSSHVTPGFIAHCIAHAIDLMVLPAHSTHLTQPLDISVFGPLKRALSEEMDRMTSGDKLQKAVWASLLVRARNTSMTMSNIKSGWEFERPTSLQPITSPTHPSWITIIIR